MSRPELLGLTPGELTEQLGGSGRARAVHRAIAAGFDPFRDAHLAAGARRRLIEACAPTVADVAAVHVSGDGTLKLLLELPDGKAVESVLIVSPERTTLCVSTQVGCFRGCEFCRTATMGLVRNLDCAEIVAQVQAGFRVARLRTLPTLRNLVFMGMGEPLDNMNAVERSLEIITADDGLGIGARHVTVSTVGTSSSAIARAGHLPAQLAWSLHAADDEIRRALVPTAKRSVADLRDDLFAAVVSRPLFVEIVLIDGLNDDIGAADAVVALFDGAPCEVRVNLLPMNDIGTGFAPSPADTAAAFRDHLRGAGLFCMLRRSRGADRKAACGQLAVLSG